MRRKNRKKRKRREVVQTGGETPHKEERMEVTTSTPHLMVRLGQAILRAVVSSFFPLLLLRFLFIHFSSSQSLWNSIFSTFFSFFMAGWSVVDLSVDTCIYVYTRGRAPSIKKEKKNYSGEDDREKLTGLEVSCLVVVFWSKSRKKNEVCQMSWMKKKEAEQETRRVCQCMHAFICTRGETG